MLLGQFGWQGLLAVHSTQPGFAARTGCLQPNSGAQCTSAGECRPVMCTLMLAGQMLRVASLGRSHSLSPLSSPKRASFGSMPRRLCTALGQESSSQDSAAST